jgi:copper resistance protein B
MKHPHTIALILFSCLPSVAHEDMKDMAGMSPEVKPAPAKDTMTKEEMDAMPGMKPARPTPKDDMAGMPGMEPNAAPPRMSTPGITILRPPQKWVPPHGDNRSAELLSRSELEAHMKPLPPPVMDSMLYSFSLFELLEYRASSSGPDTFSWDFLGWYGGDFNRLWVKSEGSQDLGSGNDGTGDLQLLYGRLIAPFWDLQVGARTKSNLSSSLAGDARTYAVIGLQGIAPGNFDIEPALYLSDRGEVSAELTASYDLYLTQRIILQPRFQGEISLKGDDCFGTGEGVTETDIGLRLRYEITREIAPYIGVSWLRSYGQTGRIARQQGESSDTVSLVAGIRIWF